ncbi:MAG: CAP domain-containing protein [Acidobacteria bacterium]|nr:CAP domain-containing protein [Acidobacteriota bacterium]
MRKLLVTILILILTGPAGARQNKHHPVSPEKTVLNTLYAELPDVSRCFSGKLKKTEIQAAFREINRIRAMHRLPPVRYRSDLDRISANAALIITANRNMTHYPAPASKCYSEKAAKISSHSNLLFHIYHLWSPSSKKKRIPDILARLKDNIISTRQIVADWIIDKNVFPLGHRRWLLNPFLTSISFGRVDSISNKGKRWELITGAALAYNSGRSVKELPRNFFVACPYGNYPASLFDPNEVFSFSAVPISANVFGNRFVNFEKAVITIKDEHGNILKVHDIKWDNVAYGVPDVLMWRTPGVKPGILYNVTISNVFFGNSPRNYHYSFRIQTEKNTH